MRKSLVAGVVLAVVAASPAGPAAASARSQRTYHPDFKRVAGTELLSGSDYVAIYGGSSAPGQFRLIDRANGRAVMTSQPGCGPDAVGGVWLAMTCEGAGATSYALYDIRKNRTLPFTPSPGLTAANCVSGCSSIAGIGTDWIAMTAPCADTSHCPTSFRFQNLSTGAVRDDPTNRTTRVDLDSPRLAQPVCRPLTVPADDQHIEDGTYPAWGSLTLDGGYGIEAGGAGVFLQRCGSPARTFLTYSPASGSCAALRCPPTSNRAMVLWQEAAGRLGGIFMKGLQRFQISVPAAVDPLPRQFPAAGSNPYTLALAGKSLYLEDNTTGTVWAAQMPSAPR